MKKKFPLKNQLIFDFASGSLGPAKSIFASTYLYLNAKASKINNTFENMLGDDFISMQDSQISNIKYTDCISKQPSTIKKSNNDVSPISKILGPFEKLKWKQFFISSLI